MDRRNLHKRNGQQIGKNKQISSRTRADNRAANQDALRNLEPEVPVVVKVSRAERLKQWRVERDAKKKQDEDQKKKPFVSVVKRGVFLDKTNYTELNKLRRKKATATKTGVQKSSSNQTRNSAATASSSSSVTANQMPSPFVFNVIPTDINNDNLSLPSNSNNSSELNGIVETNDELNRSQPTTIETVVDTLTVPNDNSQLDATFEMQNSVDSNGASGTNDAEDELIRRPVDGVGAMLAVPDIKSELNSTFEMQTSEVNNAETVQMKSEPVDMLTLPSNSSVLNTTFEMQDSTDQSNGNSNKEEENQTRAGASSAVNTPKAKTPSIKSTPKSVLSTSLNYVSPYVTISRGKGSSHKEVKVRESFYKLELNRTSDSPVVRQNQEAAKYFRFQVSNETENLMQMVEYWSKYKEDNEHVESVYLDQIDVAIGQTRLLIDKKFKQFLGLCDDCERGTSRPPVLPKDLEGFWSMVCMQVENCSQRFQKLVTLKDNNWIEAELLAPPKLMKQPKHKRAARKGTAASIGIQKMVEEARLKMKASQISATATTSSNSDAAKSHSMTLRQTPSRLSLSSVQTPRSIIKTKTPGATRTTKSVAFSLADSPTVSASPKVAATPKPRVITRRASTSGIPTIRTSEGNASFLTPNDRKVSNATKATTTSIRRSHRRLFSVAEK